MSYEVLALKYRPQVFEDLIGQESVTRTLTNAIQQNRIAHAFLFSGVRGVGKTTTARILAKALNCRSGPTVRPCGECPACLEIARGGSFDVLEIDGASNNGVAEVRDIIEAARYAPSRDRFKIYIIDEVHMLSTPAFNALLKTLEEPPPAVKFIFATTEYHKIPDTIVSRCQEYEFRCVSPSEIAAQLKRIASAEGISVSDAAVAALARAASGSLRDGISALDQVIAATGAAIEERDVTETLGLIERDVLRATARAIVERDSATILRIVDALVRGGRDLRFFTSALMQYLRDVLVCRVAAHATELLEVPGERESLEALAAELTEEDLLRALDVLTQAEDGLRTSPEPRFHLEVALLKIAQLRRLASFEELLARFESIAPGAGPPPVSGRGGGEGSGKTREIEIARPDQGIREESDRTLPERLAERLKTAKPVLHAIVSRRHGVEVEADRLRLSFLAEHKVLVEQLQQKALLSVLEEQASELAGRKLSVAVAILESVPAEVEEGRGDARPQGLREAAEQDPLVKRFVETFQGEVEDVHPARPEQGAP
jgi:DNA polymerase-3 subunit gamma/tau